MNGHEEVERKKNEKINCFLRSNNDKPYLLSFKNYMGTNVALNTKYNYIRYVAKFMDWSNKKVEDLTLDDYTGFMSLYEDKVASHQIIVYSALKKFSSYLVASGRNMSHPMQYVPRPKFTEKIETIEKREHGWMNKREIKRYIDTVEAGARSERAKNRQENWKERDVFIILLFLNTGIRCAALCKLDVNSIDIVNKKLLVIDKGDKTKDFDLSDDLMFYAVQWLNKREELLNGAKEDALFISNRRERITYASVWNLVKKYAENIEDKNITPHKLRATYGTALYDSTKDVYFVQHMMGHSNPKTTEMYIRGQVNANGQKAADIMSKLTMR